MEIEQTDIGSVSVLRLAGDLDEDGVKALRLALLECLKGRRCRVIVNLKDVRYISYMGLGVLVERLRQFRARSGDMKLVSVNLYAERLFRMVGCSSIFDTHDTEAQAVQVFREAA